VLNLINGVLLLNKAVGKADLVFLHLTSTISSGVEEINSKLTVYRSDFKSSKKFEPVPPEVKFFICQVI
jgi:hypothetical protein